MLINGVNCDTYAHVDNKLAGETVIFSLSGRENYLVVVYLYVNGQPFAVNMALTSECCIKKVTAGIDEEKTTIPASIGTSGEIIVPIPVAFRADGNNLLCEINISGTDGENCEFRYKSTNFRVSIIE